MDLVDTIIQELGSTENLHPERHHVDSQTTPNLHHRTAHACELTTSALLTLSFVQDLHHLDDMHRHLLGYVLVRRNRPRRALQHRRASRNQ